MPHFPHCWPCLDYYIKSAASLSATMAAGSALEASCEFTSLPGGTLTYCYNIMFHNI